MSLTKGEIRKKYKKIDAFLETEAGKHTCGCGCGKVIELKRSHFWNGIPRFIFGHAAKLRAGARDYDKEKYFDVEDISKIAGVSDQTVRLWNRTGRIKAAKHVGRKNLYDKKMITDFLKTRKVREPFVKEDYASVQELKRMGVSRSKLRALVREGKIHEPRHYARKTYYLREEINRFLDIILEDIKPMKVRSRVTKTAFNKLQKRVERLENTVTELMSRLK